MRSVFPEQGEGTGIALVGILALMLMQGAAVAGVATTKHNLGSSSATGNNKFDGTAEICVFCHTPHGSSTSQPVPLWNRTSGTTSYATYSSLGTSSLDAQAMETGSVSLACLSCHDGTQSMSVMINTPGSGTTPLVGAWTGSAQFGTGSLATSIAYIGTDLTNDHPVSIQYGGGGISDSNFSTTGAVDSEVTNDPYFAQPSGNSAPSARAGSVIGQVGTRVLGSGKRVWWVEANGNPGQQKDDFSLYSRTDATLAVNQPFVECASCHDPHSNNSTFLRVSNNGSAVCLVCHVK